MLVPAPYVERENRLMDIEGPGNENWRAAVPEEWCPGVEM